MSVSFTPGPHPTSTHRLSVSSPYPARAVESLSPPRHPLYKKQAKPPKASHTKSTPHCSVSSSRKATRAVPEDPFRDDHDEEHTHTQHDDSTYCDHIVCSPQQERFPIYDDNGDAERQPLLDQAGQPKRSRPGIGVNVGAGILLTLVVVAVILLDVIPSRRRDEGR